MTFLSVARVLGIILGVLVAVIVVLWLVIAPFYIVNHIPPPVPKAGNCPDKKIPAKEGNTYFGTGSVALLGIFSTKVQVCVTLNELSKNMFGKFIGGKLSLHTTAHPFKNNIADVKDVPFTYADDGTITLQTDGLKNAIILEESDIIYDKCTDAVKMRLRLAKQWQQWTSGYVAATLSLGKCRN